MVCGMAADSIAITSMKKGFRTTNGYRGVLAIPSLVLRGGELTCIVGPTGCGKTTLLNIIAGVDGEFEGTVSTPPGRGGVAYQFQMDLLLPWRTAAGNVGLPLEANGSPTKAHEVADWLARVGLLASHDDLPHTLSVGMRQRVALARTLIQEAPIVLLDEPLSAQDLSSRLNLEALLRDYLRRPGRVGIVVTHNIEEAVVLGDRIIVLGGAPARVVADIPGAELPEADRPRAARRAKSFGEKVHEVAMALVAEDDSR